SALQLPSPSKLLRVAIAPEQSRKYVDPFPLRATIELVSETSPPLSLNTPASVLSATVTLTSDAERNTSTAPPVLPAIVGFVADSVAPSSTTTTALDAFWESSESSSLRLPPTQIAAPSDEARRNDRFRSVTVTP